MLSLGCRSHCPDEAFVWQRLAAAHPDIQMVSASALETAYLRELARPRAAAALAFAFAATALIAAAAGLFSLLSSSVVRRRHEFGIRAALGASPADIRQLVLRSGLAVALPGIGIGTVGGLLLARVLASLQYGVTMMDPWNGAIVIAVLALAIAGASWRPTQHAVRTNAALLLKEE
jgi:ABC-type antimicrobial peptide transport system permease subunit